MMSGRFLVLAYGTIGIALASLAALVTGQELPRADTKLATKAISLSPQFWSTRKMT